MKVFGSLLMAIFAGGAMLAVGATKIAVPVALCVFILIWAMMSWLEKS